MFPNEAMRNLHLGTFGRVDEIVLWQLCRAGSFGISNEGSGSRLANPGLRDSQDA